MDAIGSGLELPTNSKMVSTVTFRAVVLRGAKRHSRAQPGVRQSGELAEDSCVLSVASVTLWDAERTSARVLPWRTRTSRTAAAIRLAAVAATLAMTGMIKALKVRNNLIVVSLQTTNVSFQIAIYHYLFVSLPSN